jgi:hypothetical protein
MRRIKTKENEAKKRKRNQVIVGSILIVLMLLSTAGYAFQSLDGSSLKTIEYNGYEFTGNNGNWNTNIGAIPLRFVYNPKQIVDKEVLELKNIDNYYGSNLSIYSESYDAEQEIMTNLQFIVEEIDQIVDKEEIDCNTKTIVIEKSESSEIIQENECVFIKGKDNELIRLTDSFLYDIFEIK